MCWALTTTITPIPFPFKHIIQRLPIGTNASIATVSQFPCMNQPASRSNSFGCWTKFFGLLLPTVLTQATISFIRTLITQQLSLILFSLFASLFSKKGLQKTNYPRYYYSIMYKSAVNIY